MVVCIVIFPSLSQMYRRVLVEEYIYMYIYHSVSPHKLQILVLFSIAPRKSYLNLNLLQLKGPVDGR